ncbi:hypothetical protein [Flavicella sediminum]|uniref:hypothetical protein n=1 Tax=Flavicella sediminum TaxID=2585141 RepID=UPI001123F783|nr:hypothetical protein [Flavicella sediminum]
MYKAQKKHFIFQLVLLLFGFANLYANSNNDQAASFSKKLDECVRIENHLFFKSNPVEHKNEEDLFIEVVEEDLEEEVEESLDSSSSFNFKNIETGTGFHAQRLESISCKRKEAIQYFKRCAGCVCDRLYVKFQVFII